MKERFTPLFAVWYRMLLVYQKMIWSSMATNVINPLFFLFSFGFGLGSLLVMMEGIPYLAFVMPGMMAYAALFAASFETSINAYVRFQVQKNWEPMLVTSINLHSLLGGEILWAATKALISAVAVLGVGYIVGGVPAGITAISVLPILFLGAICFACNGMVCTAHAKSFEAFSYFFTFWVTPMFMFSGVFFPITRFPEYIQNLSKIFPMYHLIEVVRPISAGKELVGVEIFLHCTYIIGLAALSYWVAHRKIKQRLFD